MLLTAQEYQENKLVMNEKNEISEKLETHKELNTNSKIKSLISKQLTGLTAQMAEGSSQTCREFI